MNTNEHLIELRKFVLIKSGLRSIDPAHCKIISEYVFQETKNYVSETTIKRFYGFANRLHQFSVFTLNSLSQYVGYNDWQSFCQDRQNHEVVARSLWQDLRIKGLAITETSLITKKNTSGVPFETTANRSFYFPDLDYFFKNNYQFATISAQPGHGKSVLLTHAIEYFFLSEQAVYKNDIVILLNTTTINGIIANGETLKEWFFKEFKFPNLASLVNFFKKNPDQREGRIILIVDDIDSYIADAAHLKTFIDFLYSIEENHFTKIVFALRTNSWINLQPAISGSAFLTKVWYNGLFYDEDTLVNLPRLNVEEILHTLTLIENRLIRREHVSPELLEQFRTPFWLQVYYWLSKESRLLDLGNPLLCYELIYYFLETKVFLAKNSTEKVFLLKEMANAIGEGGNKKLRVAKEKVLSLIHAYPEAYRDLLQTGIIIEEKRLSTAIPTEIIRFLNDDIYTYLLFIQITEKYHYKSSKPFFEHILHQFTANDHLRCHLLNWSIRFCINRNEIAELKNIFKLPFTNLEKNKAFDFICYVSRYELSKPNGNFNKLTLDIAFIDLMASGRSMSNLYKETIREISDHVLNDDMQMMLQVIECNIALVDLDKSALQRIMQLLKRHYKRLGELFPINPYDLILYFYNVLFNKPNEGKSLEEKIIALCKDIDSTGPQKNESISVNEILCYRLVVMALFSQKNYAECHRFIMAVIHKYPNIFFIRYSVFSPFLLLYLGQTYLKLNYFKKAQRIIQFLEKVISSEYTYYTNFILSCFNIFKSSFYNATHNYELAISEADKGLQIAAEHDFKIFEISLILNKIEALKHTEATEEVSDTIKELLHFLNTYKLSMPEFSSLNSDAFEDTFKILKSYRR